MTSPFADISDPAILRAMVQDGVKCERCHPESTQRDMPGDIVCGYCSGTGHTPLPNADLDALAACWCEGKKLAGVYNGLWRELLEDENGTYVNVSELPAYTTSPDAAMRLQVKYHLNADWVRDTGGTNEHLFVQRSINPEIPIQSVCVTGKSDIELVAILCRAITTAALVAALTEAIEGASDAKE